VPVTEKNGQIEVKFFDVLSKNVTEYIKKHKITSKKHN